MHGELLTRQSLLPKQSEMAVYSARKVSSETSQSIQGQPENSSTMGSQGHACSNNPAVQRDADLGDRRTAFGGTPPISLTEE